MVTQLKHEHESLTQHAGFTVLTKQTVVSLKGSDRNQLLHNFCTADIKKLKPHHTTEAFVLNEKGKILWYGHVLALSNELLLVSYGDFAETLVGHLDKFIIREDVELTNVSPNANIYFVCGAETDSKLSSLVSELPTFNQVIESSLGGIPVMIANVEFAGSGYLVITDSQHRDSIRQIFESEEIMQCSEAAVEVVRIEHQTPSFGQDISPSNLPQEIQRDHQAISFTKGCYLGQETVARIDAIGHVNQLLVGLAIDSPSQPSVGTQLVVDDQPVGRLTSIAQTPDGRFIGLGIVRRAHAKPGTSVDLPTGTAVVLDRSSK